MLSRDLVPGLVDERLAAVQRRADLDLAAGRNDRRFPDGQLCADLRGFHPSRTPAPPADMSRGFLDGLGVPAARIPASPQAQAALDRTLLADRRVPVVHFEAELSLHASRGDRAGQARARSDLLRARLPRPGGRLSPGAPRG